MPHALELPRVLRAVVPLVRGERLAVFRRSVVNELVARARRHGLRPGLYFASGRLPGLAAVVGALDDLPEPAAGLRRIEAVGIDGRPLDVVHLPAGEMGAADVPLFALAVRRQNERAFARANQDSYSAHPHSFLPGLPILPSY